MNNVSVEEAKYVATMRYTMVKMNAQQSLSNYTAIFKRLCENMKTLKSRRSTPMVYYAEDEDDDAADAYALLTEAQLKHPCKNCGEFGHWAGECPEPDHRKENSEEDTKEQSSSAKSKGKGVVGKKGKKKSGKRGQGASAYHAEEASADLDIFGYGYANHCFGAIEHLSPMTVCIDTLANTTFVHNENLLTWIHDQKVEVSGVHGSGSVSKVGHLPGFGKALVATNSKVNGLAMCEVEKRYKVTYVQQKHISVEVNEGLTLEFVYDPHGR
eukprot:g20245.t1